MKTYVELVSNKDRPPPIGERVLVFADELWHLWERQPWSMFPENYQWIDIESRIDVPTGDAELIAWHREQISAIEKRMEEKRQSPDEQARREKAKAFIAATGMTRSWVRHVRSQSGIHLTGDYMVPFATFAWATDPQRVYYATDLTCVYWTGVLLSDLDESKRKDGE